MTTVDSRRNWALIDTLLEDETDSWRIQMLSQLKEHVQAECGGDLDALMATLIDDPQFHNWSG
ncbi:MAG: nuclear transport factor 2 family protein, partial [Gammaproteobacteria bacterium]|nr:nuclear transport factor 2 family protein [Gammaproteobacteria bacterium]